MERLNPHVVAVSLGSTASIISLLCALFIALVPLQITVATVNLLTHGIDMSSIAVKQYSIGSILIGIIAWFVIAAITGYVFAFIYNAVAVRFRE